jgi:hypothetical protein
MMINTLFARNIPGEINMPVEEIRKSKNKIDETEGEEILTSMPRTTFPGEFIVDNEDPGFNAGNVEIQSPLKKLFGIKSNRGNDYKQISMFWAPEYWQPVVQSSYYGKYILSSVYTRSSSGDKHVTWKTKIIYLI